MPPSASAGGRIAAFELVKWLADACGVFSQLSGEMFEGVQAGVVQLASQESAYVSIGPFARAFPSKTNYNLYNYV